MYDAMHASSPVYLMCVTHGQSFFKYNGADPFKLFAFMSWCPQPELYFISSDQESFFLHLGETPRLISGGKGMRFAKKSKSIQSPNGTLMLA
jgi:hypothetical protein